jgi:hypothetical protein
LKLFLGILRKETAEERKRSWRFLRKLLWNFITGTVNIHKEETGKSVEALTGRGGKREMNPGTLKTF